MNNPNRIQTEPDAAFHDIGKIVNWDAVGLRDVKPDGKREPDPHEFQKCIGEDWSSPEWGIDPSALPWQSVLTWHKHWPRRWQQSMHRWHVRVADWLAAGYGRPLSEKAKEKLSRPPAPRLFRLWKDHKDQTQDDDPRLPRPEQLKELIAYLNTGPRWTEVAAKYRNELHERAEDARPGFNVTSLISHCEIVGKLASVLSGAEWTGVDPTATPTRKAIRALQSPPKLIVSHFHLGLRQRPFRARDLGVFAQMEDRLSQVAQKFEDNILSRFGFVCVAAFESVDTKAAFIEALDYAGFTIHEQSVADTLATYLSQTSREEDAQASRGLMMVLNADWRMTYAKKPPDRIDLPICEGCQMAFASKHWPKDHLAAMKGWSEATYRILRSEIPWRQINLADIPGSDRGKLASWLDECGEEDLCQECFEVRLNSPPIELLSNWEADVLYIRLALDLERLAGHGRHTKGAKQDSCLEYLHKRYLLQQYPQVEQSLLDKLFVSFPLVVDFVNDYKAFLANLRRDLTLRFSDRSAVLAEELWCLGLERKRELFEVLETIETHFAEAFHRLLELPGAVENPVAISFSISHKKHPFFDHWRFLEKPRPNVSVRVVGSGTAHFGLADRKKIAQALSGAKRSQLHSLAAAARLSESLGQLVLRERDKRRIALQDLSALVPRSLDFESARVLANLMED